VVAAVQAQSTIEAQPPPAASLGDRALPPISAFETMLSRPLFVPDRRPVEAEVSLAAAPMPPVEPTPTDDVSPPDIEFIGSIIDDNGSVRALVSDGASVQALQHGQIIDGWEVAVIEPRRLKLMLSEHYFELTILEE
jgi:hypothetical protein